MLVEELEQAVRAHCLQHNIDYSEAMSKLLLKYQDEDSGDDDTSMISSSTKRSISSHHSRKGLSKKQKINHTEPIPLKNTFSVLAELEQQTQKDQEKSRNIQCPAEKIIKKIKVPPIIVPSLDTKKLRDMLKNKPEVKYTVKITKANTKIVTCDNMDNHKKMFEMIKENQLAAHTYARDVEKITSIVMRGVQHTFSNAEIAEEIKDVYGINTVIKNMVNKKGIKMNCHIVTVINKENINVLRNIKFMCHHKISWEALRKTSVIQCKRCQRIGHVAKNCAHQYRCVKCEEEHEPGCCQKTERETEAYCVNCKKHGHPANYRGCDEFLKIKHRKKAIRKEKEEERTKKYNQRIFATKSAQRGVSQNIKFAKI